MKLKRYIVISLCLMISVHITACYWDPANSGEVLLYRIMPNDENQYYNYSTTWDSDRMLHRGVDYKEDNLKLWQLQTSTAIDLHDIEHVVYQYDISNLLSISKQLRKSKFMSNSFIKWIVNNNRADILDLLFLAKQNEKIVYSMNDPWYYHADDDGYYRQLDNIVDKCRQYKSGRLLNRYALQMVRALCTLRQYKECVKYWNSINTKLTDDVVKKMAELRVAAALNKTGNKEEALEIYAKYGDVASIRAINGGKIDDELGFVYDHCPNSPYLAGELQKWLIYYGQEYDDEFGKPWMNCDIEKINSILKVAHKAVKGKHTRHKAMWYYTLASLYDINGKPQKAKAYLERGQRYPKNAFLRDSYHVLHIWLDAKTSTFNYAYEMRLMRDLKWLSNKIKKEVTPDVYKRLINTYRRSRLGTPDEPREVYHDWYQGKPNTFYWNDAMRRILLRKVCPKMHKAGKHIREIQLANMAENFLIKTRDYSSEMFAIMDRLSYNDTRDYFTRIYYPHDEFDRFLNSCGETNKLFWYDVLATKCLRERRYSKSLVYLRQIPVSFQKELNVYNYMIRDPFSYDMKNHRKDKAFRQNCKLNFAEKMSRFEQSMRHAKNPNSRAKAKIQYALGLRNSVYRCWYLTRYSSDNYDYIRWEIPEIAYPTDTALYKYDVYMKLSDKLIKNAINTFTDKEQAAQELRKLAYYKRVMDEYGNTSTAKYLQQHCDRWRNYVWKKKTGRLRLHRTY